jgi:hypothetical protein
MVGDIDDKAEIIPPGEREGNSLALRVCSALVMGRVLRVLGVVRARADAMLRVGGRARDDGGRPNGRLNYRCRSIVSRGWRGFLCVGGSGGLIGCLLLGGLLGGLGSGGIGGCRLGGLLGGDGSGCLIGSYLLGALLGGVRSGLSGGVGVCHLEVLRG